MRRHLLGQALAIVWALGSAVVLTRCSSSSSAPMAAGPSFTETRVVGPLPPGVPASCSGMTAYLYPPVDDLCNGGAVWYLCNGATYDAYSCAFPGSTWTLGSVADAGSSDASTHPSSSRSTSRSNASSSPASTSGSAGGTSDGGEPSASSSSATSSINGSSVTSATAASRASSVASTASVGSSATSSSARGVDGGDGRDGG